MAGHDPADVLIVDDHEDGRESIAAFLRFMGFHTRTAGDGRAGLKAVETKTPDVIVVDCRMPGMDGPTFILTLRKTPALALIPVILMSADYNASEVARSIGVPFVPKPSDPQVLISALRLALGEATPRPVP